ncbi:MAG: hypothetical protein KDK97_12740 [Verrucomicrobiales bacterium]|nr:hypothetical protein [Verrucomicrobiales bacterium]MCP5558288.1 hypothetical protein [Verrucomicrobiaceae bacterium]
MVSSQSILARFIRGISLSAALMAVMDARSQDDTVGTSVPEPVIPEAYPIARYEKSWERNPFAQKVVAPEIQKENFGKDWALGGIADLGSGRMRVTIVNKQTGKPVRLSSEDTPERIEKNDGIRLVKANYTARRSEQSAEIEKGGETATVTLDEALLARPLTTPAPAQPGGVPQTGSMVPRGGAPGSSPVAALRGVPGAAQQGVPPGSYPGGRPGYNPGVRAGVPGAQTAQQQQQQLQQQQQQNGSLPAGSVPYGTNPAQGYPQGGANYNMPGAAVPTVPSAVAPTVPSTTTRRRQLIPPPVYNTPR